MAAATTKRLVLYARVSTEDQDAEPQLVRLREWAAHGNFQVVGEFKEVASGRLTRRAEQDKVMALVRGRHVHAVAVAKLDRWGRSIIDLRNSLEVMVENGVWFHAVESGVVYEKHTSTGKLLFNQLASFAEFEADLISERTKESLAVRKGRSNRGEKWVSKTGRTVNKLGHEFHPCFQCGGPRVDQTRGKRKGKVVMLCRPCKGLPALPVKPVTAKVAYVETQVEEKPVEEKEEGEEEQV